MARKDALRLHVEDIIGFAGLAQLKTRRVEEGQIWCFEHTAWEIELSLSGEAWFDNHKSFAHLAEQCLVEARIEDTTILYQHQGVGALMKEAYVIFPRGFGIKMEKDDKVYLNMVLDNSDNPNSKATLDALCIIYYVPVK